MHLSDYCESHDLRAIVSEQKVSVCRLNGHVAFTIERRDRTVSAVKWKPDGSLISIAWDDGVCGIYSGEDGKVLSQTSLQGQQDGECWLLGLDPDSGTEHRDEDEETVVSLIDWTAYTPSSTKAGSEIAELTRSIAAMDATRVLPSLSPLPTHVLRFQPDQLKFTTKAGIDALMDTNRLLSETVTTFISPESRLHHIDLPLEKLGGSLLQVVATNTKRMQNIVAYIMQAVRCLQTDFTSNNQLPTRLINNLSEELSEKKEGDVVTNLYQLAMTGYLTKTMNEWLSETIKETTHKRWDKSVNDMYNHIQTHIFMHLVPALDRLAIATNAIRGNARFLEDNGTFVPSAPFTSLLDDIHSLRLLVQQLQLIVMTEHRQFRAFSKWIKVMIDIAAAGPGSKAAYEIEEREFPNLDDFYTLAYVKDTLSGSKLTAHLDNNEAGGLLDLTSRLSSRSQEAVASITRWQSGMLRRLLDENGITI